MTKSLIDVIQVDRQSKSLFPLIPVNVLIQKMLTEVVDPVL